MWKVNKILYFTTNKHYLLYKNQHDQRVDQVLELHVQAQKCLLRSNNEAAQMGLYLNNSGP